MYAIILTHLFVSFMDIGCQILCPFMLDQFYWADRMFWLGVAPEPLKRNYLVPDNVDDTSIKEAAEALSQAIQYALSPRVKECEKEIAERISVEVNAY